MPQQDDGDVLHWARREDARGVGDATAHGDDPARDPKQAWVDEALAVVGIGPQQLLLFVYVGCCWMSDAMEVMLVAVLAPAAACEWGVSPERQSLLASAGFAGMMLASSAWGAVADLAGRKAAFGAAACLAASAALASAAAPSSAALTLLRLCVGAGLVGVLPMYSLLEEWLPRASSSRGKWLVALQAWWSVGTVLESLLAWGLFNAYGWRALLAASAMPLVLVLATLPLVPESPLHLAAAGRTDAALAVLTAAAARNGTAERLRKHLQAAEERRRRRSPPPPPESQQPDALGIDCLGEAGSGGRREDGGAGAAVAWASGSDGMAASMAERHGGRGRGSDSGDGGGGGERGGGEGASPARWSLDGVASPPTSPVGHGFRKEAHHRFALRSQRRGSPGSPRVGNIAVRIGKECRDGDGAAGRVKGGEDGRAVDGGGGGGGDGGGGRSHVHLGLDGVASAPPSPGGLSNVSFGGGGGSGGDGTVHQGAGRRLGGGGDGGGVCGCCRGLARLAGILLGPELRGRTWRVAVTMFACALSYYGVVLLIPFVTAGGFQGQRAAAPEAPAPPGAASGGAVSGAGACVAWDDAAGGGGGSRLVLPTATYVSMMVAATAELPALAWAFLAADRWSRPRLVAFSLVATAAALAPLASVQAQLPVGAAAPQPPTPSAAAPPPRGLRRRWLSPAPAAAPQHWLAAPSRAWLPLASVLAARFAISGGFALTFILVPEQYPPHVRASALGAANALARLGSLVAPYLAVALPQRGAGAAAMGLMAAACVLAALAAAGLSDGRGGGGGAAGLG